MFMRVYGGLGKNDNMGLMCKQAPRKLRVSFAVSLVKMPLNWQHRINRLRNGGFTNG